MKYDHTLDDSFLHDLFNCKIIAPPKVHIKFNALLTITRYEFAFVRTIIKCRLLQLERSKLACRFNTSMLPAEQPASAIDGYLLEHTLLFTLINSATPSILTSGT